MFSKKPPVSFRSSTRLLFGAAQQRRLSHFQSYLPRFSATVRQRSRSAITIGSSPNRLLSTVPASQLATTRGRGRPRKVEPAKKNVSFGDLDQHKRANSVRALLTKDDIATAPRKSRFSPPGYEPGMGFQAAHLIAHIIGGSSTDPRNFVTMYAWPNQSTMKRLELKVRRALERGEQIYLEVKAIYTGSSLVPSAILFLARGSNGLYINEEISNAPKQTTRALTIPKQTVTAVTVWRDRGLDVRSASE